MLGRFIPGGCFAPAAVAMLVLLGAPRAAPAEDSYYMLIFGQQAGANKAALSHTFATFVKGSKDAAKRLEVHTISWMPASLNVKLVARPEPGVNLDLQKTLELARSRGLRVSMWGPFQIDRNCTTRLSSGSDS